MGTTTAELGNNYRTLRRMLAFAGPGFLVAVGYMDPGNWATDIAAGSQFNYKLLSVIFISNLLAILLQSLALKLGVVSGLDLAQACRQKYSRTTNFLLWIGAEIAIAACDLAEIIGSAIALQLLLHIPLLIGVVITAGDALLILILEQRRFRTIEIIVFSMMGIISACFLYEIAVSHPAWAPVLRNTFVPSFDILRNRDMLYISIGILGATVMPHNLYLHSATIKSRATDRSKEGIRTALKYANWDSFIALMLALLVNAAILVVAAATFFRSGHHEIAEISDAYRMLTPLLGAGAASTLFAVALLASGQNSTLTGTLAGQVVMQGHLNLQLRPWLRRLITRGIAVVPTIIVIAIYGENGMSRLLIFSQVILSMQLCFAIVPLVLFTSERARMGEFANGALMKFTAWAATLLIGAANLWLIVQIVHG